MKLFFPICLFLLATASLSAQNQAPVVEQLSVQGPIPSGPFTLNFNLSDAENDAMEITVQFSNNGGKSYQNLGLDQASGDVGFPVMQGSRSVVCTNLGVSGIGEYLFRVIADDRQPFDLQALVNEVDSNRLRMDLEFVEGIRHRTTGLAHLNETRDSLTNLFKAAELHVEKKEFVYTNTTGQNLIGTFPGTHAPDSVVIVDAHYDSVSNAPGADDNGSGTVGMMEIARLLSRYTMKKTVRYIGFDLEEAGLRGSIDYVTNGIPASEKIAGVFNFEMIGYWSDEPNSQTLPTGFGLLFPLQSQQVADNQNRGDFITNVGNTASQPIALLFSNAAQQYVPSLKVITLDVPGTGSLVPDLRRSDHAPFWDSGRRALMLTDGANFRNECYHTPGDTLNEKLNFTFMSNVVKATLASVAQLAEIQHADWATTGFSITSSIPAEVSNTCGVHVFKNEQGLYIQSRQCHLGQTQVELYDISGGLVLQQSILLNKGEQVQLPDLKLTPGLYVLKLTSRHSNFAQKVLLGR
ncbi:MAG: M28 family peptidase [Saprospiraceae bacterium]|nr:M28 family peptidase [Saprospiraceae bacterium]